MPLDELDLTRVNDFHAVRIALASPADVLAWSSGEVTRPDTVNYRTHRPERGGLFCERIFGPEKDWECACGRYRGVKFKAKTCERCGVDVTHSRVRRKRMGHIELAAPVVHIWFYKARPCVIGHLLGMKARDLDAVVHYRAHVVLDPGTSKLAVGEVIPEHEAQAFAELHSPSFRAGTGPEAVEELLQGLDLPLLARQMRRELDELTRSGKANGAQAAKVVRRLEVIEALGRSPNRPEWMVLRRLPVIPPDLRPVVLLDSGNYASSDLNDLYRRVLTRNARLKKLLDLRAPEVILRNEKRLLQQAVDALFDNGRTDVPMVGAANRPLKSLADMLQGKQGRFRENLLGKRVDYSGRSVIVVGPELKLHQCGLPKKMAVELYQPFLLRKLREADAGLNLRRAKRLIQAQDPRVWDALEAVMQGHPVLLNRAPTLHRMGIQAFEPVLVEGNAIRLHPLVCKAFNADFDGDQMAVHLPLSVEAVAEAKARLAPAGNIFSPASGQPILAPGKDMVLGCYYLTADPHRRPVGEPVAYARGSDGPVFASPAEVIHAHAEGKLRDHDAVVVRLPERREVVTESEEAPHSRRVKTTAGRVLFDDILPPGMPFYDLPMTARNLGRVIADCEARLGRAATVELLERVKEVGFRAATRSGLSFATDDLRTPADREAILAEAQRQADELARLFEEGLVSEADRREKVTALWERANDRVRGRLMEELARDRSREQPINPVHAMVASGARGSAAQVGQLAGMRGLMRRPSGEVLETPIKASFRDGLSPLEYFNSTHGARKGLVDTALRTADAGYLTRKLVDVAQHVVVREEDCGTRDGIRRVVTAGRVSRETIVHPLTDEPVVREGEAVTAHAADVLRQLGVTELDVRSPMKCRAENGVCRRCYGVDLATGALVEVGTAVGVIAAQSIGEPATQLTMRTFHTGGVAAAADITLSLPRVIELFEAHRGKRGGPPCPHAILRDEGPDAVRLHLLDEVQKVYRHHGVDLDDRHVEVIVAQMLSKVKVVTAGDTDLLPGQVVERSAFAEANVRVGERGRLAEKEELLLGVSKAAVRSASFLSAASFQETARVLTEAALAGKTDPLAGLKENVLVGRLVPAGTGYRA